MIKFFQSLLLFFFLFGSIIQIKAQNLAGLEVISTQEKLSNPNPLHFQQDQNGIIWISTIQGLNRFDGYEYVHYNDFPTNPNFIPASFVHKVICLSGNRLLIHAKQQLFILNSETNEITDLILNKNLPKEYFSNDFTLRPDGTIWLFTFYKGVRYLNKFVAGV